VSSIEAKKEKIRELLECPVDWLSISTRLGIINLMREHWGEFVRAYQVDDEGMYVRDDLFQGGVYLEIETDDEILDWQIRNIESWVEKAREDYIEQTRRLADLKMADRQVYDKHFPKPTWTNKQVEEASPAGVSYFYSNVTVDDLMDLMWESLPCRYREECAASLTTCDGLWRRLLLEPQLRLFVQAAHDLGASNGKPTRYACFDFDLNTPQVHAYPVGEDEIEAGKVFAPHIYPRTWKDQYVA
jgi:hypothetical protein